MGFSRQEYWSVLSFPSPGDLPNSGIEPGSSTLQADSLLVGPPGVGVPVLETVERNGKIPGSGAPFSPCSFKPSKVQELVSAYRKLTIFSKI